MKLQETTRQGEHQPMGARRAALTRLAGLCGLALSGEALSALAQAGRPAPDAAPEILTRDELALTGLMADLIIPRTSTPGATGVGAHRTIDHLLAVCALPPAQQTFRSGLARIDAIARQQGGKRFAALPPARQIALLNALDQNLPSMAADDCAFFSIFKRYTVFAYYTSEPGATRELAYLPIPGGYKGDLKAGKTTRAWAMQ